MAEQGNMIYICGLSFKKDTPQEVIDYIRNNISSMRGKAGYCANYLILPAKKYQPGGRSPFNLFIAYQEPREQSGGPSQYNSPPSQGSLPEPQRFGGGDQTSHQAQFEDERDSSPPSDEDCPV